MKGVAIDVVCAEVSPDAASLSDELIRHVTIECAERGLLLLRVRDEIRMTIAAYQTLYESSIAFGMRKAIMTEQKKAEMQSKVESSSASSVVHLQNVTDSLTTPFSMSRSRSSRQRLPIWIDNPMSSKTDMLRFYSERQDGVSRTRRSTRMRLTS